MNARAWTRPKPGHTPEENEDVWVVAPGPAGALRLAVADGATEGIFSRAWAEALAEAAVAHGPGAGVATVLADARAGWAAAVADRAAALPWYAAEKMEGGAFATLLVLDVTPAGFDGWGVGDAEAFVCRAGTLHRVGAHGFDHRPPLLASRTDAAAPAPVVVRGALGPRDALFVATDALAAYLAGHPTAGRAFAADFDAALAVARAGGLRSDDVTLVRVGRG